MRWKVSPWMACLAVPVAVLAWIFALSPDSDGIPKTPPPETYAGAAGRIALLEGTVDLPKLLPQATCKANDRATAALYNETLAQAEAVLGRPADIVQPSIGDPTMAVWYSAIPVEDPVEGVWPVAHVVVTLKAGTITSVLALGTYARVVWIYPFNPRIPTKTKVTP